MKITDGDDQSGARSENGDDPAEEMGHGLGEVADDRR
jgi:hypothetical protein